MDDARAARQTDLSAVLSATFLVRFAFGITTAVFASYLVGHDAGLAQNEVGTVGWVTAMASLAEFSTVILSGIAADRWGRWRVLAAGLAAAAVFTFAFTATRGTVALAALNFGFGVASGAILAASLAIAADDAPEDRRGHTMGRFDAANLAGWVLGFAVGLAALGYLPNSDLAWVFPIGAFGILGGLVYAARVLRRGPVRPAGVPGSFRAARALHWGVIFGPRGRRVAMVIAPWLFIYMLIGTALVFIGSAASGDGISPLYLALGIAGGGIVLTLTQPTFGTFADRFGTSRMMYVGTAGFVLVLSGAILITSYGVSVLSVGVTVLGAIFALMYGPAALSALAGLSSVVSRASTMAVYTLCIALGMTLGLALSSGLYSAYGGPGLDAFFASVAGALVILAFGRSTEGPTPEAIPTTPAR